MKRFIFQFASVLNIRKLREDEALRALGVAQRAQTAVQEERNELFARLNQSLMRRELLGQTPTTADAIRLEQDFIAGQKYRITRHDQMIVRAQRSVEKAFRTYLSTRRQTQMLETLRERHLAQYKMQAAKKERQEQDDLSVMRAPIVAAERMEDSQ